MATMKNTISNNFLNNNVTEDGVIKVNLESSQIKQDKWGVHYFVNEGTIWFRQSDIFPLAANGSIQYVIKGLNNCFKQMAGPILLNLVPLFGVHKVKEPANINEAAGDIIFNSTRLYYDRNVYVSYNTVQKVLDYIDEFYIRARRWSVADCEFVEHYFGYCEGIPNKAKQLYYTAKREATNAARAAKYVAEVTKMERLKHNLTKLKVTTGVSETLFDTFVKRQTTQYSLTDDVYQDLSL